MWLFWSMKDWKKNDNPLKLQDISVGILLSLKFLVLENIPFNGVYKKRSLIVSISKKTNSEIVQINLIIYNDLLECITIVANSGIIISK